MQVGKTLFKFEGLFNQFECKVFLWLRGKMFIIFYRFVRNNVNCHN